MEEYTPEMVNLFYAACIAEEKGNLLDGAVAARVSQADKQGWTTFTKDTEASIAKLVSPIVSDPLSRPRGNSAFFKTIQTANARRAAQNGHLQGPV